MISWQRMYPQEAVASQGPGGYIYGTVCRVNLWVKMTTALAVTQIIIGISCVVFYMIAFFTDRTVEHLIKYMATGLVAGSVIMTAGILGLVCCKKKSKCTIAGFLIFSTLSALLALFPMVLGVVGATTSMLDEESLMMPICQLVFATVEIVVATWSVGVCCQAICCPNATFGYISTRLPTGFGFTQFISSGEGQHVVLFTSSSSPPPALMYNVNGVQQPYLIQQGVPTVQVPTHPGITCAIGQNSMTPPPAYYMDYGDIALPDNDQPPKSGPAIVISSAMTATHGDVLETENLLHDGEAQTEAEIKDASYELDSEETHLLC